jgi:hypothetical protein
VVAHAVCGALTGGNPVKVKFIASSGASGQRGREVRRCRGEACLARRCPGRPGRPRGAVASGKSKVHCIIGGSPGAGTGADVLSALRESPSPRRGEKGIKVRVLS